MNRKLALKREVLAELTEGDLQKVAAGTVKDLSFSCMTYISCYPDDCLLSEYGLVCLEG